MNAAIDGQRQEVEDLSLIVGKTNVLISGIQEAQNITNEYLFSQKKSDLERYEAVIENIDIQIQELGTILSGQGHPEDILKEVSELLEKKKDIVKRLSLQFNRKRNPIRNLKVKIDSIQGNVKNTETVEVTIRKDSLILPAQEKPVKKKSFWDRVKNVFVPTEQPTDTAIHIVDVGTTHKTAIDTVGMFRDLRVTTNQVSVDYQRKITEIEQRVRQLIVADADIFTQISQLLTRFHEETLQSVFSRTYANEQLTREIFQFAVNSGGLSLLLILFIILLIAGDLIRGRRARHDLIKEKQLTDELMESRHKLLLSVSHDIKTPLSSMIGYMDLWRVEEPDPEKKRQLQSALNSGGHILNMLSNLLEYSRLEKRAYRPKESVFNLPELCAEIIEMFRPIADEKNLELRYDCRIGGECFVCADHTGVKQILSNIISNAIKYTEEGAVELTVEDGRKKFKFRISDTGVGMDMSKIENVFRPFLRMDNSVFVEGSGFGLYVTKGLTLAMGGSINVESELGKGTVVNVALPLDRAVAPDKLKATNILSRKSKKILVFEDDNSFGNVLVEIMQRMGHSVELCEKCDTETIDTSAFDIVFTDMEMGKVSGNDVLKAIRKTNEQIPVWLLTAHGDITESSAKESGFSGLISKPVTLSALDIALQTQNDGGEDKKDVLENPDDEFPALFAMFDGDRESINEVLQQFTDTVEEDLQGLQRSVNASDFAQTRRLCHKILPFLLQLGSSRISLETPQKMNALKDGDEQAYPEWEKDVRLFKSDLEAFVQWIKTDFLNQNS